MFFKTHQFILKNKLMGAIKIEVAVCRCRLIGSVHLLNGDIIVTNTSSRFQPHDRPEPHRGGRLLPAYRQELVH